MKMSRFSIYVECTNATKRKLLQLLIWDYLFPTFSKIGIKAWNKICEMWEIENLYKICTAWKLNKICINEGFADKRNGEMNKKYNIGILCYMDVFRKRRNWTKRTTCWLSFIFIVLQDIKAGFFFYSSFLFTHIIGT